MGFGRVMSRSFLVRPTPRNDCAKTQNADPSGPAFVSFTLRAQISASPPRSGDGNDGYDGVGIYKKRYANILLDNVCKGIFPGKLDPYTKSQKKK